jgi:hypothetical protein
MAEYTPSYTLENLHTLEQAYASGALRVRYGDKEIWYHSAKDQAMVINEMKIALGLVKRTASRSFAEFKKGV